MVVQGGPLYRSFENRQRNIDILYIISNKKFSEILSNLFCLYFREI